MTSYSGSIAYLKYQALSAKNGMQGKELNSVFGLGEMNENRMNYTSQIIVEEGYTPSFAADDILENGVTYQENGTMEVKTATYKLINKTSNKHAYSATATATFQAKDDAGVLQTYNTEKIAYNTKVWQMQTVPANDIPTIGPKMEHIALVAEPRRIAVRYDQITAFQA